MNSIKARKPFFSFLLLFILLIMLLIFFNLYGLYFSQKKIEEKNNQRISGIIESIKDISNDISFTDENWFEKISIQAKITAVALRQLVSDGNYNGQEIFEDGAVVRIDENQIIFPEDFQGYFDDLDLSSFENNDFDPKILHHTSEDEDELVFTVSEKLGDGLYYIAWTPLDNYTQNMNAYLEQFNKALLDMEKAYGAYFIVVSEKEGELLYFSDQFNEYETIEDLGFSLEDIDNISLLTFEGNIYSVAFQSLKFLNTDAKAVILINFENELQFILRNNYLVIFISAIVLSGMILQHYWVTRYVQQKTMTKEQYNNYLPRNVRKKTFTTILASSLVIFFISIFYQSLGTLQKEADNDQAVLEAADNFLQTMVTNKSVYQQKNEEWNIYYAERIAELMSTDPALQTQDVLAGINDVIDSDYIMLFDSTGNEIASSNSYVRFKLTDNNGTYNDFSRLLMGVDTIVHDPEQDQTTGKYIQITGTKVAMEDDLYGALLIATNSQYSWEAENDKEIANYVSRITPKGNLFVITDTASDTIQYSSDPDLEELSASNSGLNTGGKTESSMDSFNIKGGLYYGPFQETEPFRIFYLTQSDYIGRDSFSYSFYITIGFIIVALIIALFTLIPYRTKLYKNSVTIIEDTHHDSLLESDYDDDDDIDEEALDFKSQGITKWWRKLRPEQKTRIYIRIFTGITLILIIAQLANPQMDIYKSSIGFVLRGNWTRGFNLLAFAAILLLIIGFLVYTLFKELMVGILINFMDPKGETVLRLVSSLIHYSVVVGLVFASLNYIGINTTVMIAGFSAFSLAISLGGKDLVADILAGIFIIFEDDFHVGDFIEVNGFTGIVQEIGVRSTKIIGLGDNIKIIGNQNVKNVLNMSKLNSWYTLEISIPQDQPIEEIENMLRQELPAIGAAIPEIISGPVYKGIWSISDGKAILAINSECKEINIRRVQRKINHELILLFKKYGYKFG